MPPKKKTAKKKPPTKPKALKTRAASAKPTKKIVTKSKPKVAARSVAPSKSKSSAAKARKPIAQKTAKHTPIRHTRRKAEPADGTVVFEPKGLGARSGGQSGDLQGLANSASSNSESVDELLEEGNYFEAGVIKGVEDAGDADEKEVTSHEVPEDDVPDEYLQKEND